MNTHDLKIIDYIVKLGLYGFIMGHELNVDLVL
jgi:hypothetical protein